jgi:SAM-dependent methyltransferase
MRPKPAHLGPTYGAQFADVAVAAAYDRRPPYPAELFAILTDLIPERPRTVADAGCGSGDLARPLAALVGRVDAVDPSAAMIARGRARPGGDAANLRWIESTIEAAALDGTYGLITAGESLHWMEWAVTLPRFRDLLAPGGVLAIVGRAHPDLPWWHAVLRLIGRYSTNKDFRPYDLLEELATRGLFRESGQSVDDYIESIHSRNGFSRDRMTTADADAFDAAVRAAVAPYAEDGLLSLPISGTVVWGVPLAGNAAA